MVVVIVVFTESMVIDAMHFPEVICQRIAGDLGSVLLCCCVVVVCTAPSCMNSDRGWNSALHCDDGDGLNVLIVE
jgi:hypothetical protein